MTPHNRMTLLSRAYRELFPEAQLGGPARNLGARTEYELSLALIIDDVKLFAIQKRSNVLEIDSLATSSASAENPPLQGIPEVAGSLALVYLVMLSRGSITTHNGSRRSAIESCIEHTCRVNGAEPSRERRHTSPCYALQLLACPVVRMKLEISAESTKPYCIFMFISSLESSELLVTGCSEPGRL